jgi:predicted nucleic acid-binding OB-fold protein
MKTNKKEKTFDAVKMMRDIRDKISEETQNMTFEQLTAYIKAKLTENNAKIIGQK